MEIKDLLKRNLMIMELKASNKMDVIDEISQKFFDEGIVESKEEFKQGLIKREEETSTALGEGIAMPHSKNDTVKEPAVLFAKKEEGLDYEALDGEKSYIFFSIAVPNGENNLHVETLAQLSKMILKEGFIDKLKEAKTPEDVYNVIDCYKENIKEEIEEDKEEKIKTDQKFIIGVTACPNGVAHTYMAQEALEKAGKINNVRVKIETNGSDGVKNRLTDEDIKNADAVIIAADKKVEMSRFDAKKLIQRPVSDGIRKSDELIKEAISGSFPIYYADNHEKESNTSYSEKTNLRSEIYKDLMNGVSHMLPFVIGGGILMAISFLFERFFGDSSIAFIFLNKIGISAFNFLIPVLAGYIAYSIADRPALMPGMVAGLLASEGAGFLGGLLGGFIAGLVVNTLKKVCRNMPKSLDSVKPMLIYPVFGLLITGVIMFFIVDPIFTGINNGLNSWLMNMGTTNKVLIGSLLGAMMAADMGGPINKAAYTFATGAFIGTNDGAFMAAVMAGGMVPPIAIALASTLFKNKFNENERKSALSNYLLGLSFITEGAIPFAAAKPQLIIPISVIGAGIAGGLTQLFNVSVPAPHGGVFVLPAMSSLNQAIFFILSFVIGSIVSAILLGIFKKKED
ncbi:fructose-specific PTS transporter subunit EIIC [Anaerococcus porci]|uniref:PTS fructose transporter subunit IIABC n=1 Tax=Anaerococcus porci TaxID=2652269 RepID=UPI002A75C286|nr:fructose-specific PTS transporter subunit EIIC [Anaerococcus porci]MDY3005989.1 fructose-specific PTS transporter subunit EIIC [Anaerococcus porci]